MMTVVATLKQQYRNVLEYMTDACQAAYTGLPAPSLLPRHTEAESDLPVVA
jgi:transposase